MKAPEATAQPTASGHDTWGSSGLTGGALPVAAVQPLVISFLATTAAPIAEPVPRTFQTNAPMTTSSSDSALRSRACHGDRCIVILVTTGERPIALRVRFAADPRTCSG